MFTWFTAYLASRREAVRILRQQLARNQMLHEVTR